MTDDTREIIKAALTPKTKRIIVAMIGTIGVVTSVGWVMGSVDTKDAMIAITPIITGFFALVRD